MDGQNDRRARPTLIDDLRRRFLDVNESPNDYNHSIDRTARDESFLCVNTPNVTLLSDWSDS